MSATPKRTALHAAHVAAGARMIEFAGYEMPVQYTGIIDEHVAVRTRAGLFDVSHMGEVRVRGAESEAFLQWVTSNDVSRLRTGRAHYTALMNPQGGFVDDMLVYRLGQQEFLLVVNAANVARDVSWLEEQARRFDAEVVDESDQWGQLAVQGPESEAIVASLTTTDIAELRYYGFVEASVAGHSAIVSRTGYTGEDGFELYLPALSAPEVWDAVVDAGAPRGLVRVGLAARDTLRLEAKMALYGNDIDETTTPLEADLGWIVKWKKGDFVGREVLARQKEEGVKRKLVGFAMDGRAIARHGYQASHDGRPVGLVTSGTFAPHLRQSIGLVYLPVELTEPGTEFQVEVRGRSQSAKVVPTPFYKRPG